MTTNTVPDEIEYGTAYKIYLRAFIGQFADPAKDHDAQTTIILTAAVALGVRDGNASRMSGSTSGLPLSEQAFGVAADVMLGHAVPGKEPGVG